LVRRAGSPFSARSAWLLAGFAAAGPAHAQDAGMAASAGPWVLALALAAACAVAGYQFGTRRHQARQRALHDRQQALGELLGEALWATDATHRLIEWRPCRDSTTIAPAPDAGSPIGQCFRTGAADDLATRLAQQQRLDDVSVRDAAGRPWRLRAVPRFDIDGTFAGFLGTAQALTAEVDAAYARQALDTVLQLSEDAILLARQGSDAEPRIVATTAGAQRLMGIDGVVPNLGWQSGLRRLAAPVADAAATLQPGEARTVGAWALRLGNIDDDRCRGQVMVIRHLPPAPEQSGETVSLADHESFTYSVSHDLRAPIRVVDGFARILKEDYGRFLDRIGNDHVDRILAAAARMNSMIDALLALSKLQSQPLVRKPVDLSALANYIMEDLRRETPDRRCEISIEPGITVNGDPTLLRVVMDNLLGNAWKYSSQTPVARIEFRRERVDNRTVLLVADNGAGFDMRFADRLFGVFQRLHSPKDYQGTGVGLASVKRILARHGGDIWAESEIGKGARFYFTLE